MNDKVFYVYSYSTEQDGIFWIGKGIKNRINDPHKTCKKCYNILEARKRENVEITKEKIYEDLTEKEAFAWEKTLIWLYEPKANLTTGGEGASGYRFGEEAKKKISGENNKNSKLCWKQVEEIRKKFDKECSQRELADFYSVSEGCVQAIVQNRSWVNKEYEHKIDRNRNRERMSKNHKDVSGTNNPRAVLNWDKVKKIREEYKNTKKSYRDLSVIYGVSKPSIRDIIKFRSWSLNKQEK